MKATDLFALLIVPTVFLLVGCSGAATESEKEAFYRSTMGYENQQEQSAFVEAINPNEPPLPSGPPSWEAPVN